MAQSSDGPSQTCQWLSVATPDWNDSIPVGTGTGGGFFQGLILVVFLDRGVFAWRYENPRMVVLAVIGFLAVIYLLLPSRKSGARRNEEEFFISTAPQSADRARNLLPTTGREDRRDLLKAPELPVTGF
jgi:hypothetical protein